MPATRLICACEFLSRNIAVAREKPDVRCAGWSVATGSKSNTSSCEGVLPCARGHECRSWMTGRWCVETDVVYGRVGRPAVPSHRRSIDRRELRRFVFRRVYLLFRCRTERIDFTAAAMAFRLLLQVIVTMCECTVPRLSGMPHAGQTRLCRIDRGAGGRRRCPSHSR
jgi:hypothetical protein